MDTGRLAGSFAEAQAMLLDLQARLDFRVLTLDRYRAQRELDKETIADLHAQLASFWLRVKVLAGDMDDALAALSPKEG
jgi:hypothetical protein